MEAYNKLSERGVDVDRREYSDYVELVADFGPSRGVFADTVGETVIIVVEDETYELELTGDVQAFIKNGVLTIEQRDEVDA